MACGNNSELCGYLVKRVLGVWESELLPKECRFCGIAVRGRDVETEGWVDEGLCGFDDGAETEHGGVTCLVRESLLDVGAYMGG